MSRQTPPGRVQDLARAACEVFIEKGYRRALMTDVAARLEINHALLYRSVESKESLLELAARYAMDQAVDLTGDVPLPTPPRGHTLEMLRNWIREQASFPVFRAALKRSPGEQDAAAELDAIIDEFYSFIERARLVLSLMDSLVIDYPEFNELFVNQSKRSHIEGLAAFLSSRASSGGLRTLPDPEIAAHFIVESVAWFAMHRKDDPSAAGISDERARSSMRGLLLSTFVADASTTGTGLGPTPRI
jgi:AcrR family transcriptional regulator